MPAPPNIAVASRQLKMAKRDEEQLSRNFLRVIHEPKGPTEVDIIAVHGLNPTNSDFHAENTWTKGDKLWLRDFLPRKLPTARILLFGYNANVAFEASTSGVLEQAHNLLNWIRIKRRKESAENRPVIFIAHSLGGIVVKRALVVASQVEKHKAIRAATYGIVFFATPHRGGENVLLGSIAAKVVRAVYQQPSNDFLEALKKDSLFGNTMIDDFRSMLEDFRVISYFETRPVPNIGIVVDKRSANLGLSHDRESNIGLDLDHRQICKFDDTDGEYEMVEDNIIEMVEEAIDRRNKLPSAPTSPDPSAGAASPPIEQTASLMLLPAAAESTTGLSEPEYTSAPYNLPRAATYAESMQSLAISDDTADRRHSSSTGVTSTAASISTASSSKVVQSPRLFPSLFMNMTDSDGSTFRKAAAAGKKDQVMSMLAKGQAIDNSGVGHGFTALAEAALNGHQDVVKLLLEKGANPAFNCISTLKQFGSIENTPLALAAGKGHLGCMASLLEVHKYTTEELDRAYRAAKYRNRSDAMSMLKANGGGLY